MSEKNNLYARLEFIGFGVYHNEKLAKGEIPDIEHTLIEACYEVNHDGRMLGLLFSWLKVHGDHLVADKLFKEYQVAKNYLGESPWFYAMCAYRYHLKDHRFKKGVIKQKNPVYFGKSDNTLLLQIKGAIDYLQKINIHVAVTSIRIREGDAFTVEQLLKSNEQYRNRYIWGANWRAEIIGLIKKGVKSPGEISKLLGLARSRVAIVFKEYMLVEKFADLTHSSRTTPAR